MIFLSAPSPYASDPSPTYISENDRASTEFFQPHQYRYTRIRQSPTSYGKAVHIKHCITAGTKHAIDGNFVDGAANHIDAEHNKHSL